MAQLLVTSDQSWYDELNAISYYYESDFERTIKQQIKNVFSDHYAFSLKQEFTFAGQANIPDLGLLRKDFKEWWIVEVELGNHTLTHVKNQVKTFSRGRTNFLTLRDNIFSIVKEEYEVVLKQKKILEVISNTSPKILVIVDQEKENWITELEKLNVSVCFFQIYKNTNGHEAYRLVRDFPMILKEESHCRYLKSPSNILEVLNANFLQKFPKKIELIYNGSVTGWEKFIDKNKTYLKFVGTINPIPVNSSYVIFKDKKNKLYIKGN